MSHFDYEFWSNRVPFETECWIAVDRNGYIYAYSGGEPEPDFDEGQWHEHPVLGEHNGFIGTIGEAPNDYITWELDEDGDDTDYLDDWADLMYYVEPLTDKDRLQYFELQQQHGQSIMGDERPMVLNMEKMIPLEGWDFFEGPQERWPKKITLDMRRNYICGSRIGLYHVVQPQVTFPYFVYELTKEQENVIQRATEAMAESQ